MFHDLKNAELAGNLFFVALLKFWIIVSLPLEINLVNKENNQQNKYILNLVPKLPL